MNQPMKPPVESKALRFSAGRVGAVLGLVAIFLAIFSVTVVETGQVAVVIRTGSEQPRVITEPGLYGRLPFVDRVWLMDTRLQISEQRAAQAYATADKQTVQLAGWLAWQVVDPVRFSTATANGKNPIDEPLFKAFSEVLTGWLSGQTAAGLLAASKVDTVQTQRWLTDLNQRLAPIGIQAEQAGLRQALLTDAASDAIYQRMTNAKTRNSRLLIDGLAGDESQLLALQARQQNQVLDNAYQAAQASRQSAENQLVAGYARLYGAMVDVVAALKPPAPTPLPAAPSPSAPLPGVKADE